jgi:hypothetical protein
MYLHPTHFDAIHKGTFSLELIIGILILFPENEFYDVYLETTTWFVTIATPP